MVKRLTVAASIGKGQWPSKDGAMIPDGYCRKLRNMVRVDGAYDQRHQFTYDSLPNVRGLGVWFDAANKVTRLVSGDDNGGVNKFYVKGVSGETWSSDVSGSNAAFGRYLDELSYRGKWFGAGSSSDGITPLRVTTYDGTTFTRDEDLPFAAHSLAAFKERLVFGGVRFLGSNLTDGSSVFAYNPSSWTLTTVSAATIAASGTTLYRVTPTATTGSKIELTWPTSLADFFGSLGANTVQFRPELRSVDPVYSMPITAQIKYSSVRANSTAYTVGQVVTVAASPGFRFRATVAGTSAGAAPAFSTTVGATTTDGTVTWICDGSDVAAQAENIIPNASVAGDAWTATYVVATIPSGAKTDLNVAIKFGNTAASTITLAPMDFGYLDGLAAANPLKQNHGQQVSFGEFLFPFFSNETVGTFPIDQSDFIYLSEPAQPSNVRASRFYRLTEYPGAITGVRAAAGRLVAFKRNARWVFGATEDPANPILPEGEAQLGAGALNGKAIDIGPEGLLYYVGEDEVYRWNVQDPPVALCGEAMRAEVMNKSSASWCESQALPANRALLKVDPRQRHVWVYTQKGKLYCYHIDTGAWSTIDAGGGDSVSPVGYQICDMAYSATTGHMYFAFSTAATGTAGLARLDPSQAVAEDQISSSGTLPVVAEIWPRPIEVSSPSGDYQLDTLRFYHNVTASQADQETSLQVSFDQGVTFTKSIDFDIAPLSTGGFVALEAPIFQAWHTLQTRLVHTGKGGASNFSISRMEADLLILRGYYPKTPLTSGASTL